MAHYLEEAAATDGGPAVGEAEAGAAAALVAAPIAVPVETNADAVDGAEAGAAAALLGAGLLLLPLALATLTLLLAELTCFPCDDFWIASGAFSAFTPAEEILTASILLAGAFWDLSLT
jgi:hypothetical protein